VYYSLKSQFVKSGYGKFVVVVDFGTEIRAPLVTSPRVEVLGAKVREWDIEQDEEADAGDAPE
jgi:hypothetical protein